MNARERFHAVLNFEKPDRLPLFEVFNWWDKTLERWRGEGLDTNLTDRYEICDSFGLDPYRLHWLCKHRANPRHLGHLGANGGVKEYQALREQLFSDNPFEEEKFKEWAELQKNGDAAIIIQVDGMFWFGRELFGVERNLYSFYDDEELYKMAREDLVKWNLRFINKVFEYLVPDAFYFTEDMSYKRGSMISKACFDEFIAPYYHAILPTLKQKDVLTFVDSDGEIGDVSRWFSELGVDGMLPCEVQAGTDLAAIRKELPNLRLIGGFDKTVMHKGESAIRAEFERLMPIVKQGGFIISCDHQAPPEVSLENYKLYLKIFLEYAEKIK